jgi:WD repeat-containing protein 48
VLRHIFSKLIDEMIKTDEVYRKQLNEAAKKETTAHRGNPPTSIQIPPSNMVLWANGGNAAITPRANGNNYPMTPGMGIGVATPAPVNVLPGVPEDGTALDKKASRTSAEKPGDYFLHSPIAALPETPKATPVETHDEKTPLSPSEPDKEENGKDSGTRFGKKFRMGMSFGSKKLGRSASTATEKPVVVEEKSEGSETSETNEKEVEDSFHGIIQKIQIEYDKQILEDPDHLVESLITPSLPNETPVLKPPPMTTVIIQEETSGGSADLYRGTVGTVGEDANLIEQRAPMWLGDLLLRVGVVKTISMKYADGVCRIEFRSRSL